MTKLPLTDKLPPLKEPSPPPPPAEVLQAAANMYNAGVEIVTALVENAGSLPADFAELHGPVNQILASLGDQVGALLERAAKLPSTAPPPPQPPTPVDVTQALRKIVEGIAGAEGILNKSANLAIASGTVEAELMVQVPGGGGAHARITLQIQPKPYS